MFCAKLKKTPLSVGLANIVKLFHYLYRTSGRFDRCLGFIAHCIYLEAVLAFQFAVAEDFNTVELADEAVDIKILETEFCDTVLFSQVVDLTQVQHFIFDPIVILETAFGDTALDRHLATFVCHLALITGTALSALITFCGCAALSARFTAADTFFFVSGAFCWS